MPPHVPVPAPRKARPLPWVAMTVGILVGLGVLAVLWNVMVELQQRAAPSRPAQVYEPPPPAH